MDVETAFWNPDLVEEIYVVMPSGHETPELAWRLLKALYGLKQSPRAWNTSIDEYIRRIVTNHLQLTNASMYGGQVRE